MAGAQNQIRSLGPMQERDSQQWPLGDRQPTVEFLFQHPSPMIIVLARLDFEREGQGWSGDQAGSSMTFDLGGEKRMAGSQLDHGLLQRNDFQTSGKPRSHDYVERRSPVEQPKFELFRAE